MQSDLEPLPSHWQCAAALPGAESSEALARGSGVGPVDRQAMGLRGPRSADGVRGEGGAGEEVFGVEEEGSGLAAGELVL